MTLQEWCACRPHGEIDRLATACRRSREQVSRITHGHARPTLELAIAIYKHTGGVVSLRALLDPTARLPWPVEMRLFDCDAVPSVEAVDARMRELVEAGIPATVSTPGLQAAQTRRDIAECARSTGMTSEQARATVRAARLAGLDWQDHLRTLAQPEPHAAPSRPRKGANRSAARAAGS